MPGFFSRFHNENAIQTTVMNVDQRLGLITPLLGFIGYTSNFD